MGAHLYNKEVVKVRKIIESSRIQIELISPKFQVKKAP